MNYGENSHGLRDFCSRDAYVTTQLLGLVALLEIKCALCSRQYFCIEKYRTTSVPHLSLVCVTDYS